MNQPLVSIITPVHNSAEFLHRAVESVFAQTLPDWELILVDDASTDGSGHLIDELAERDQRVVAEHMPANEGAARTRNRGIERARGRFIAFLDSDDSWEPAKLEQQIGLAEETGAELIYGAHYIQRHESGHRRLIRTKPTVTYNGLLNNTMIATSAAMFDTEKLGKVYMPDTLAHHDLGLWLDILRHIDRAHGVNEPVATIYKRSESLSGNKISAAYHTWRLYRDYERLSLPRAAWHFGNYAGRALFKYLG